MKIGKWQRGSALRFNMTPLIDVTFLLIIFALLISHFVQQAEKLLRLPKADQAQDIRERLPRKLIITVSRSGVVTIGGRSHHLQTLESVFRGELGLVVFFSVELGDFFVVGVDLSCFAGGKEGGDFNSVCMAAKHLSRMLVMSCRSLSP